MTIVRDSPRVADVARATGCVEELDFLRAMLLQRGRISFILRELNFGTAVLRQLLLQHAHLTIVRDSPCVAAVAEPLVALMNLIFCVLCCCKGGGFHLFYVS